MTPSKWEADFYNFAENVQQYILLQIKNLQIVCNFYFNPNLFPIASVETPIYNYSRKKQRKQILIFHHFGGSPVARQTAKAAVAGSHPASLTIILIHSSGSSCNNVKSQDKGKPTSEAKKN